MSLLHETLLTGDDVRGRYRNELSTVQGYTFVNHGRDHVWLGLLLLRPVAGADKDAVVALLSQFASGLTDACELYSSYEDYQQRKAATTPTDQTSRQELRETIQPAIVKALGLSSY